MKTVWKFELRTTDSQTVSVPRGGKILLVAVQRDVPCLWIEVDPKAPKISRRFAIYGTGHAIATEAVDRQYVGSYFLHSGSLVFHVFELVEKT